MENFNKQSVKILAEQFKENLKSFQQSTDLDVRYKGCSYNDTEIKMIVLVKVPISQLKPSNEPMTDKLIQNGAAKRGQVAMFGSKEVVIEETKRTKYVFTCKDNPGKLFIAPMSYFKAPNLQESQSVQTNKP